MNDKEKITKMWQIINRFVDHMIVACNTSEAIDELRAADASDELLLALGFSQKDINDSYDEWEESYGIASGADEVTWR